MKKIFALIICLLLVQDVAISSSYVDKQLKNTKKNLQYETVKTHTATYNLGINKSAEIKDPGLIKLSSLQPVNEAEFKEKTKKDEEIYNTKIRKALGKTENVNAQPYGTDFYNLYRITERLIRANKLDYMNWRVCIRKTPDNFNASSSNSSLITINTALYDSFAGNDDAMAFVIAHEMAHSVYGSLKQDEKSFKRFNLYSRISGRTSLIRTIWKYGIYKTLREQEYVADIEGAILMTRAGYDMEAGMQALNFMNTLPVYDYEIFQNHPDAQKRINSMNENRALFSPEWTNEGKYNVLHSDVLSVKKSSDRVSMVISRNPETKNFFEPETFEDKLLRVAYMNYKNGNMEEAVNYFKKLSEVKEDAVIYLYISYANEYLYNKTNSEKYLKEAVSYAKKANAISKDKYSEEQLLNLIKL